MLTVSKMILRLFSTVIDRSCVFSRSFLSADQWDSSEGLCQARTTSAGQGQIRLKCCFRVSEWERKRERRLTNVSFVRTLRPSISGCVSSSWSSTHPTLLTQDMMYPPSAGWLPRCVCDKVSCFTKLQLRQMWNWGCELLQLLVFVLNYQTKLFMFVIKI